MVYVQLQLARTCIHMYSVDSNNTQLSMMRDTQLTQYPVRRSGDLKVYQQHILL